MPSGLTIEDSPVEMLLKEQGALQTPVGLFSGRQEAEAPAEPAQARFYKQLLPLSKPGGGEQYAFKVDLDRCTGCKACVSACHSLNGLDDEETWRDVGSIHGGVDEDAYAQTVTTACHHCADPACLNGCPVLAYEKDPETGIVRHLDDQCIGCQYCVLKCPYDVPKYSKKLGIVRKCDMCQSRLADGEAPACAQACPTEAISITIVDTSKTVEAARAGGPFLPGAPDPEYTVPTTQYVTRRTVPEGTDAADRHTLRPEHGHYPLVVMLVLTQLSVGLYGLAWIAGGPAATAAKVGAFVAMALGLAASTSHLGRPLGAWRAFLGLRRSWLSREIVVFGAFSGLAFGYTASAFVPGFPGALQFLLGAGTLAVGGLGVFCSAMIYHDTQRPFWRLPVSLGKFSGTTLGLGLAGYVVAAGFAGEGAPIALTALIGLMAGKLLLESKQLRVVETAGMPPAKKSALLLRGPLRRWTLARFVTGGLGIVCCLALFSPLSGAGLAALGLAALFCGELLERALYFKAVAAPKMPGGHGA